ncbi:aminotransferase class IV [Couchioplanes caeruleus]|uniref:aminotransferase class IV n=1 Tax=Couchioplanes caeruleus TaxID=56438 RepID=UPI00201BE728|nr:aminotransferase class IV [Couchioplanes caeruleus]UQU68079.1 aminotransferase class IV [Couchioplanes caeruleus]
MDVELNGRVPGVAELHRLIASNYGHYTSLQVRDGRVRGLALHLARLADGAEELFGHRVGVEEEHRLLGLIRHALGRTRDASVRVTLVPGPGGGEGPPDVLVSVSGPAPEPAGPPLRVQTVTYERDLPEHKHRGTFMLDYHVREARLAGFDDRLFVGRDGRVREGSSWNLALWDGEQVVWPVAPVMRGITMVLLQIAMTMNGTPWTLRPVDGADLASFAGAATLNSAGIRAIGSIDELPLADAPLTKVLAETWAEVPWDEL